MRQPTARRRAAIVSGITAFVLVAVASIASGTLPAAFEVLGAIPPAIFVGFLVYHLLPAFGTRR